MKKLILLILLSIVSLISANICKLCVCQDGRIDCLRRLVGVPLSANLFANPPDFTFELSLRWNDLKSLPEDLFTHLPYLERIDLGHNQLETLPEKLFDRTPTLMFLSLETGLFSKTKNLNGLTLSVNRLTTESLPSSLLNGLSNLRILDLAGNKLGKLPDSVAELTMLEELLAYNMNLNTLQSGLFSKMKILRKIEFAENDLTSFPSADTLPASLQYLGLAMNRLQAPPTNLKALTKLTTLTLAENAGFTCLTQSLSSFGWNLVKDIDACTTRFYGEVYKIGNLGGIANLANIPSDTMTLVLKNNQLTEIPAGAFDRFTELYDIDLSFNNIKKIPAGLFDKMPNLQMINLAYNQIDSLPAGIFKNNKNLITINLAGNKLDNNNVADMPNLLKGLNNLNMIQIEFNNFKTIPAGWFDELTNLKELTMFNNKFETLPEGLFAKTTLLESIDLTENFISSFPKNTFTVLKNLKKLTFLNNQLNANAIKGAFEGMSSLEMLLVDGNPGILCIEITNYNSNLSMMPAKCDVNSVLYKAQIGAKITTKSLIESVEEIIEDRGKRFLI